MRILVVDDDPDVLDFLKRSLKEEGFAVDTAADGDQGSYLARTNDYDVVLLDCALPGKDGFAVVEDIRTQADEHRRNVPIIMISVTGSVPHKVTGLASGADDYVTKPFFFEELLARIHSVLRRPRIRQSDVLRFEDLVIDTRKQTVMRGKQAIYLTRKEFALLEYLARHSGEVVSRSAIAEHVWDINADPFSNTIETHILNLRKKIDRQHKKKLIHSVPGRGYKIDLQR